MDFIAVGDQGCCSSSWSFEVWSESLKKSLCYMSQLAFGISALRPQATSHCSPVHEAVMAYCKSRARMLDSSVNRIRSRWYRISLASRLCTAEGSVGVAKRFWRGASFGPWSGWEADVGQGRSRSRHQCCLALIPASQSIVSHLKLPSSMMGIPCHVRTPVLLEDFAQTHRFRRAYHPGFGTTKPLVTLRFLLPPQGIP